MSIVRLDVNVEPYFDIDAIGILYADITQGRRHPSGLSRSADVTAVVQIDFNNKPVILRWIKETPDPTLQELSERLDEVHQVIAPTSTINDWFRARKISFKKTAHASEQERADGQAARVVWRQRQARLPAHPERVGRIVFLDETSINTKMARLRGRCPSGQRMVAAIPHGHWKTMTFIAGLRGDGLTAPWVP